MIETGRRNASYGAAKFGFRDLNCVHWNLPAAQLYEFALVNGEARVAAHGPLVADTGVHTGRSPKDKFIVRDVATSPIVWWDNNNAMTAAQFDALLEDFVAHARGKTLFAQDLYAGADPGHRVKARVFTELGWHSLFIRNLLIRPAVEDLSAFAPDLTIVDLPTFQADPARHGSRASTIIACDFTRGIVLIGGTSYAGEMKKAVFTYLNYVLPGRHVMPMHCSANTNATGETAIFFGLSGTGKTTLSADPDRMLIGDDEHGWSRNGVFNFEGGCYAKAIRLSREAEPQIYATTERFGTVMENVTLDPDTREPDFDDESRTENTRIAYPLDFIANASASGRAAHPKNIVMLTCDAFGVLPPIAKLDPAQAMYHFLSGYTAKVAGTEKGVTEPQATFSTCFGAPFLPLHPTIYGNLLRDYMERHHVDCWLRQHRLDRRQGGRRPTHADPRDAPAARRRARRIAAQGGLPHRSAFRPRRAARSARRRAAHSRSHPHLAQEAGIRGNRGSRRANVPRQFPQVRGRRRRGRALRRPQPARRLGLSRASCAFPGAHGNGAPSTRARA